MQIDLHIMELLNSKICHDLISPIGAINNGLELVEELGIEAGADAVDLIGFSAHQASAKLKAYRMAYGAGGADKSIQPEDVYHAVEAMIEKDGKITQDWDHALDLRLLELDMFERPDGFAKIMICGFLLAMDCLPKGGTLSFACKEPGAYIITAKGEDCGPKHEMEEALGHEIAQDDLEPKHVHAHVTTLLCQHYGYTLVVHEKTENTTSFLFTIPKP